MTKSNKELEDKESDTDRKIMAMAESLLLLEAALKKLIPKRRHSPLYYYPRLYDARYSTSLDWKTLLFDFIYARNRIGYPFTLPVFTKLELRSPQIADAEKQKFSKILNEDSYSYTDKFIKILYHPIFMAALGLGSAANIVNMALTLSKVSITSLAILKASGLLFGVVGLAASLCYFIPAAWYYYNHDRLRHEILDIFEEAMEDIGKDNTLDAWNKIHGLKFPHSMLLHPNYPNNRDLRWSYHYMSGLILEKCHDFDHCESYKAAFLLADTPDEKFLVVQGILNVYDWRQECVVEQFNVLPRRYATEKERQSVNNNKMHIEKIIAPYAAHLDPTAPKHQALEKEIHYQLQECITNVKNKQYVAAKEIFEAIKWGGYCKKAYPRAAIIYYQIQSILTLCMEPYEPFDMETPLCPIRRLKIARENLIIVQEYIDNYYPEMSKEHQEYIDLYDWFDVESDKAFDTPNPYIKPIIYSEFLPVSEKTWIDKQDDIVEDVKNLYKDRSPSPTNFA
jgi:hypothetical protein